MGMYVVVARIVPPVSVALLLVVRVNKIFLALREVVFVCWTVDVGLNLNTFMLGTKR